MTISYYVDEDIMRKRLIRAMRLRGLDVVSAREVGMMHRPDEEQLEFAKQHGRVLFSFNVGDFCRLNGEWLHASRSHAGIIVSHQWQRHSIGTQLRGLLRLSAQRTATEMQNQLEYLSDWI